MALFNSKKSEVVITVNSQQPKAAVRAMKVELDKLTRSYQQLSDAGKAGSQRAKTMLKDIKDLKAAIKNSEADMQKVDKVVKNLGNATLRQLRQALKQVNKEIENTSANNPRLVQLKEQYRAIDQQIRMMTKDINSANSAIRGSGGAFATTLKNLTAYFGLFQLFSQIQSKLTSIIKLNLQFSDQLADIRKVSGLAMTDINRMSENLAKIDTRTTIQELNQIAYAGAKLGIGKWGTEALEQFVRASNQVNVALKEDLGADALTALSKITEVMGLIPKMGVEKSMLATGSAMFQLAATSTATAGNIVEFSKRLTGMARTAGITTDQLLALGSAADSMYLMPEVASTAFNKFITALQKNHNLIEKQLQIDPGTISNLYSTGRIVDAMVLVFERMNKMGNMNVMQDLFKDLGSDGARLVNVMVTMSKNVDMLKDHLYTSSEAFEEATAVTTEYNIQQETANALMERASNIWEKAFVNPTGVDYVKSMAQQWYDLSKALTESNVYMGQIKLTLGLLWTLVKLGLYLLPALIQFMMFKGSYTVVVGMWKGMVVVYQQLMAKITGATVAQQGLNTAMKANIFGIIISLLSMAAVYMFNYGKETEEAADSQRKLNSYLEDAAKAYDDERRKLESYRNVLDDANLAQEQRERIIKKFNHEYQPYLTKLGLEVKSVGDLKGAYEDLNAEIKKKMYYQMRERAYSDKLGEAQGGVENAVMDYSRYVNGKADFKAFDTKWLQSKVDAGLTADEIYKSVIEQTYGKGGVWSGYNGDYIINNKSKRDSGLRSRIANFVNANKNYTTTKTEIDDAFNPIIGDYDPFKNDDLGELERDAVDKRERAKQKAEEAARRKALRAEMKAEQEQAKAVMDNVKNYYERQIAAITDMATKTNMDPELQAKMVDAMKSRMNDALANVRKAIAGVENGWSDFRETMINDLYEPLKSDGTNESTQLLDNIIQNDVDKLREMIKDLSKALGQSQGVLLDQIWRKATENQLKNAVQENKASQERQKIIMESNYTGKVDKDYEGQMEKLQIAEFTPDQTAYLMGLQQKGGKDAVQAFLDERSSLWREAFVKARENMIDLISNDPSTEKGRKAIMTLLYGADYENRLQNSPLKSLLTMEADKWQVFYEKLIAYGDDYTEALKKVADREKKLLDFRLKVYEAYQKATNEATIAEYKDKSIYQFTDMGYAQRAQHELAKSQRKRKLGNVNDGNSRAQTKREGGEQEELVTDPGKVERTGIMGGSTFFNSFKADPALAQLKAEMELRKQAMELAIAEGQLQENIAERKTALWQAQAKYYAELGSRLKAQMEEMYGLAAPVETFGTNIGKAFATMTEDAEAGRKAIRAAIGDMINGFMEQTVKMTEEWIKRRLMQTMYDNLMSKQIVASAEEQVSLEEKKQDDITDAQKEGGEAKQSIFKKIGSGFMSLFKKQKKDEVKMEEDKQDEIIEAQETGGEAQEFLNTEVKSNISKATAEIGNETLQTEQAQVQQEVQTESAKTQANTTMGIASGASKIIGTLGWWGIPLIAVITALLNGLLSFAMSKVASLFGGGSDSDDGGGQTAKLVTGMLTYDSGNVQAYAGVIDGKSYPVVGSDGNVYAATDGGELSTGLVKDPITTFVNGQPALVAEKGPEMVIGRETTAAMMMARPDLMAEIVKFDRNRSGMNYRVFDEGNVGEFGAFANHDGSPAAPSLSQEDVQQLRGAITEFTAMMLLLQKNGLHVNKYGRGGIAEEAEDGAQFMGRYSGSRLWNKKK